jgi:O-6-methylguanine DNA methyltransferase
VAADFTRRVLTAVRRIPPGKVATYGDIAALAGSPRASRAVGNIMRECRDAATPCHRVIAAGGGLGGYGGNLQLKRQLLRNEGIEVVESRIRAFRDVRWRHGDSGHKDGSAAKGHKDGAATKATKNTKKS